MAETLTRDNVGELLRGIRYVLLDCDGVLWSGDAVFEGIYETLAYFRSALGLEVRFVTNAALRSRQQLLKKSFIDRGFTGVRFEDVYSSAFAAAEYLRNAGNADNKAGTGFDANVYVIGGQGLHDEIQAALAPGRFTYGLELEEAGTAAPLDAANPKGAWGGTLGGSPYNMNATARCATQRLLPAPHRCPELGNVSLQQLNFGAVVVGFDCAVNLSKMAVASMALQQHAQEWPEGSTVPQRCRFLTTNEDPSCMIEGVMLPANGVTLQGLVTCTEMQPEAICGKPNPALMDIMITAENNANAAAQNGAAPLRPDECLMVGDRLTTDVAFGLAAGARTLMVLSGCETVDDIAATGITPHFVARDLTEVMTMHRQ
jgi:4-nitrophenyl phosphatase